ncbi:hypothetical protein M3Y99_00589300 [Aphelenchoides fujianensis]|nr:hypothetical protein M3Y99_00589300 [Aphelenchoides fujianensis]
MFESLDNRLPYIPPPDYSVRFKPQPAAQRRPQPRDDHGLPHHYQPQIRAPQRSRLSATIDEEPEEEPRNQSPDEVKRRVLRMLKEQGVPVFPIAPSKEVVEQANPANLGPTRAYIKHLENHRKYDTLNSFRSCDNCPICKQMQEEIDILEHGGNPPQRKRHQQSRQQAAHNHQHAQPLQPLQQQKQKEREREREHELQRREHELKLRERDFREREQRERQQAAVAAAAAAPALRNEPRVRPRPRSDVISGRLFEPLREAAEPIAEVPEPDEPAEIVISRVQNANSSPKQQHEFRTDSGGDRYPQRHKLSVDTYTSQSTASPPEQRRRIVRVPEARIRRDYAAATDQQLSVRADERVKVLQTDTIWSLCTRRADGQIGWVPTGNLMFESGSSLGSSPLLN